MQYNCIDDDSDQRNPSAHDHFDFFSIVPFVTLLSTVGKNVRRKIISMDATNWIVGDFIRDILTWLQNLKVLSKHEDMM